jgi:hypothetical protein
MATQNHGRGDWKSKTEEMAGQASAVAEKAEDITTKAAHQAKDMGQAAMRSASDAASFVGKKAEEGAAAVGDTIESMGKRMRDVAPQGGMLGSASSKMADCVEASGHYIKEHGLSGIGEDLTGVVRRNPIPAILACVAVGYLIARATRS